MNSRSQTRPTKTLLRSGKVLGNQVRDWTTDLDGGPVDLLFDVQGEPSSIDGRPTPAVDDPASPAANGMPEAGSGRRRPAMPRERQSMGGEGTSSAMR